MAIESTPGGGITITGERDTRLYQLLQWKYAIKLEIKGIHVARRSVTAHVKRQLGFKGNRESVLAQLEEYIDRRIVERDIQDARTDSMLESIASGKVRHD